MTEYVIFEEADGSLTVNLNGGEITIGENMKLSEMKECHINYRKYEKLRKLSPEVIVGEIDLIKIIEKQNRLLHDFRHMHWHDELNPKGTSVRDSELWQMIRECFA